VATWIILRIETCRCAQGHRFQRLAIVPMSTACVLLPARWRWPRVRGTRESPARPRTEGYRRFATLGNRWREPEATG